MYNKSITMNNKQLIVRINEQLKNEFEKHCLINGFSVSKRLRVLILNDIQDFNKLEKDGCGLQNDKSNKIK